MINAGVNGWILDVVALIEVADGSIYAQSLLVEAARHGRALLVPVTVLAEVYNARPDTEARERLAPVRDEHGIWLLSMLTEVPADQLRKLTVSADGDRTLAHVAFMASQRGWPVVSLRNINI